MRGVENIEGPTPSLGYMFATRSIVHVVETCIGTACTAPLGQIGQPNPVYSLYIRKFTQLLVIRTKLANWPNWGINVEIATKSGGQIRGQPRFKTGQLAKNWPNLGARVQYSFRPISKLAKKLANLIRHSSHTNIRSVVHPPYQAVQRVVQQSPQRLVETPLIEDLLDPNRPRNGLIDGRLALQVVVVQD